MTAQVDRVDRWRIGIALVSIVAFLGIIVVAARDEPLVSQAQSLNGDVLGQSNDETLEEYVVRAEDSLRKAPQEESVFSLITLATPLTPEEAAVLLRDIPRVNALVLGTVRPLAIPEPTGAEDRAAVMIRYMGYAEELLEGTVYADTERLITGVVAYATGDQLRQLRKVPQVLAVETLPPDAQWNSFGVQPVKVQQ